MPAVTECRGCDRNVANAECSGRERPTDHVETCPDCRAEPRGAVSETMPGFPRFGIVAFAARLPTAQMVPPRHVAQKMKALVGIDIAEATPPAQTWRPKTGAEREEQTNGWQLAPSLLHVEWISIRTDGRRHWLQLRRRRRSCVASGIQALLGDGCPCIDIGDIGGNDHASAVRSHAVIRLRRSEDSGMPSRCSRSHPGTRQPQTPVPRRGSSEVEDLSGHSAARSVAASG